MFLCLPTVLPAALYITSLFSFDSILFGQLHYLPTYLLLWHCELFGKSQKIPGALPFPPSDAFTPAILSLALSFLVGSFHFTAPF